MGEAEVVVWQFFKVEFLEEGHEKSAENHAATKNAGKTKAWNDEELEGYKDDAYNNDEVTKSCFELVNDASVKLKMK